MGLGLGLELGRLIFADAPNAAGNALPLPSCPINALTWPAVIMYFFITGDCIDFYD